MSPVAQAASDALTSIAPKVMTGGGVAGALGWLLSSEVLGLAGLVVALLGLLLTRMDKRRDHARKAVADARAAEIHSLMVARLKAGLPPAIDQHLVKDTELDE